MVCSHSLEIVPVDSGGRLRDFIAFPHWLYRGEPAYVPRLNLQEKQHLSSSNPYFQHSEAQYFLARSGSETLGRIAWFLNRQHLAFSGRRELFFGYFDTVDDLTVAGSLLQMVHEAALRQGCTAILGPIEFSTNDTCGLLTEGFDRPPAILMPFHAPHQGRLLTAEGYAVVQELLAYEVEARTCPPTLLELGHRLGARLERQGITVRTLDFARFDEEVAALFPIYETVFGANWGFMPLTWPDFLHQAKGLKQVSREDFVLVAEYGGRAVAYLAGIYDANLVFAGFKDGRLLPFNLFKLGRIGKVSRLKVLNLGVVPEFRHLGIEILMYAKLFEAAVRRGIQALEASYVMGSNVRMQRSLSWLNARITKRYAIFRKPVQPCPG
jgi:ribosomal protein S18 acetylase RimI-like enzyme